MKSSLGFFFGLAVVVTSSVVACSDDDGGGGASNVQPDGGSPSGDAATGEGGTNDDAGGNPSTETLGAGPYTIAYAGTFVGIDMRAVADGKATFDGAKLLSYEASTDERPELGTNTVSEAKGDALVAIGRWSGGTTAGKFYEVEGSGLLALPANGGFHYAIGKFTDPLPASGNATYTELAKTVVTVGNGSTAPGTLSGSVAATFAGADSKIGFTITLDVPGDATYTIATTGGTGNVATTETMITSGQAKGAFITNVNLTSTGAACGGGCAAGVDGFVAGPNAERIALVAHIYKGGGGSPESLSGAIVFTK
jgi:hypothetical protein